MSVLISRMSWTSPVQVVVVLIGQSLRFYLIDMRTKEGGISSVWSHPSELIVPSSMAGESSTASWYCGSWLYFIPHV